MALVIGQFKLGNLWRSQSEILNLIISHLHRYPEMRVKDAYKLLYQGTMGPEHENQSASDFDIRLREEYDRTTPDENLPLWENLRPDGEIVRVNFAPYKMRGGDARSIATLCLWTQSSFKGSTEDLKESWETFKRLCQDGRLRKFNPKQMTELDEWLVRHEYPPVPHSDVYIKSYKPAYRLIRREFLNLLSVERSER